LHPFLTPFNDFSRIIIARNSLFNALGLSSASARHTCYITSQSALKEFYLMRTVFLTVLLGSIHGCGGGSSGDASNEPLPPPQPANRAPLLTGISDFTFDENEGIVFTLQVSDPDGDTVTASLERTGDGRVFAVDSVTATISSQNAIGLDFENPQDENQDNVYQFGVTLTDGLATSIPTITVTVNDIDDPLICSSGDTIIVPENVDGTIYTFVASKPVGSLPNLVFGPSFFNITRAGGSPVSAEFENAIGVNANTGELQLFHILNAENEVNLQDIYTISMDVTSNRESATCSVNLILEDIQNEVTAGIKFSGSFPSYAQTRTNSIGDIDGDGLDEIWLGSRTYIPETPWEHQGFVVFGKAIETELALDGTEEILMKALDSSRAVRIYGSFPPVRAGRFIGNDLLGRPVGDIDGDGISELLLLLQTPSSALESTFVERPMAYVIWGDTLLSQADGTINLNTLTPDEGMVLEGLGGIDRLENTAVSGDFDADGIPDIAIGIPFGAITATDTSVYRGQIFFVFGSYIRSAKSTGRIDLFDGVSTLDPNQVLLLTAEDENDVLSEPPQLPLFSGSGREIATLGDIDGDGGDELVTSGVSVEQWFQSVGIISSQAVADAKGGVGILEYRNIPTDQVTAIRARQFVFASSRSGDADGDGQPDLIFGNFDYSPETPLAVLVTATAIESNLAGNIIDVEAPSPGMTLFNHANSSSASGLVPSPFSFLGDLDGDGRDDLLFSYRRLGISDNGQQEVSGTVTIVLAKALDEVPADRVFWLDQMVAGDGLHISGSSVPNDELVYSALEDIDADGLPELLITRSLPGTESFLIPGSVLADALQAGQLELDLRPLFRNSDP